jgi:hypothetical protein
MDLEEVTAALTGIADRIDFARLLRYDNRALDGYMERQATAGCPPSCRSCDYCSRWAGRAQEWDAGLRDELLGYIRRYRLLMLSR